MEHSSAAPASSETARDGTAGARAAWRWPGPLPELRKRFESETPYPHLVVDGVFDPELLLRLYNDVPAPADPAWIRWWAGRAEDCRPEDTKKGISDLSKLPRSIACVLELLIGDAFVNDLRALTGVSGLVADHSLNGGGLQCSGRGAHLRVHADPIRHPSPNDFDQAINLIVYANPHWRAEYGGNLELWSKDCSARVHSIAPLFNRMVVFHADRSSFHGHPEPNRCPEGLFRTSLALYYYVRRKNPIPLESNRPVWR